MGGASHRSEQDGDRFSDMVNLVDGSALWSGDGKLALFEEWDLVTADDERRVLGSYPTK
jgi:hypothetical protein